MGKIEIRYFANAAFQITSEQGVKVLIDPCLTGHEGKGISPVKLDELTGFDLIIVTHGGFDHVGDTLELARRSKCSIMCGTDVRIHLANNGIAEDRFLRMFWGAERTFKGLTVRCVESRHISYLLSGNTYLFGIPLGFIIYTESGVGIYHPGDTSIFSDVKLFAELYHPQVGLLGIGGFPGAPGELSPREAALIAKWMKLKVVIPMHYPEGSNNPVEFKNFVKKESPKTQVKVLNLGESLSLDSKSL